MGRVKATRDKEVKAVIAAFDEHLSYVKLMRAFDYIINCNCLYIATNMDHKSTHSERLYPGTGTLVQGLNLCVGRPALVMGKPSENLFRVLSSKFAINPKDTIMIGDK